MGRKQTLPGRTFGRITVKSLSHYKGPRPYYLCECTCGTVKTMLGSNFYSGRVNSCGCLRTELRQTGRLRKLSATDAGINNLVCRYRKSAEVRGYTWELTRDVAKSLMTSACHYCGIIGENSYVFKSYDPFAYNGIDRVDNDLGYTTSNVVTCCGTCNKAKGSRSYAEFTAWLDRVAHHTRPTNRASDSP